MMHNTIVVNNSEYAYSLVGKGETVVLFHGFTGTKSNWEHIVEKLCRNYSVFTIDLPGHGDTTTNEPKTMETFAQDFKQITEKLNLAPFHLLGYSMGGRTALSYAFYYPQTVRSLILESASPGLATQEEREQRQKQDEILAKKIESEGIEKFVSYWSNIPLFQTQKRLDHKIQLSIRNRRLMQKESGLAQSLIYMGTGRQPSWWGKLHKLEIPVLLLCGEEDEKFVQINQKMHKQLRKSTFHIIKNAGHAIHLEQAEIFVKIVMEYLNKISDEAEQSRT